MTWTLATNATLYCSLSFPIPSSTTYLCTSPSNLQPPVHIVHMVHCTPIMCLGRWGWEITDATGQTLSQRGWLYKPYPICIHWGVVYFEWAFKQNLVQVFFFIYDQSELKSFCQHKSWFCLDDPSFKIDWDVFWFSQLRTRWTIYFSVWHQWHSFVVTHHKALTYSFISYVE